MTARIVVTIDRTSLSLSPLLMGEGTLYRLPPKWLNVGISDYRRGTPTAPNVPGRQLTDRVLDGITFTATTNIGDQEPSTSADDLMTAFEDLIAAVRQDTWTFQVAYDTAVMKWTCEPAAIAPDFSGLFLQGFLPVTLTVPRSPIPLTGPF